MANETLHKLPIPPLKSARLFPQRIQTDGRSLSQPDSSTTSCRSQRRQPSSTPDRMRVRSKSITSESETPGRTCTFRKERFRKQTSPGISMTTSLTSLHTDPPVRPQTAMTGKIGRYEES